MVKCSLNLISYIQRQRKSGCWKCCFQLLKICEDFDQTCYDQMRTPQTNAINKNPLRSWSTNRPTVSWLRFCDCARVHLTCATIPSVCHTVCVEMMTLLLIFYFFVSYLVFDILENNEENLVKDFRTVFWTKKFPFVRFNINTEPSHWTHRDEEFLLLLFLLLGFLSHHLVFLLELLQCSDLRLLEAKCLLLIVRSQPGELLLIALVFLAQRLRTRGRLEEVKRLFVTDKERIKKVPVPVWALVVCAGRWRSGSGWAEPPSPPPACWSSPWGGSAPGPSSWWSPRGPSGLPARSRSDLKAVKLKSCVCVKEALQSGIWANV